MYTQEMLRSASEDSLCEALVFLLSCSYIYQEIGEYLQCTSTSSNPYQDWIDQYSNLERRKKVDEWIQMINQMAKPLCKEAKEQLKIVFSKASQFEYDFWDETYNSTCK
jgi:thiaminase/transcriptional activator TenA